MVFSRRFCRFIFTVSKAVAEAHGVGGTGTDTHSAADAFGVVGRFRHIHIHLAGSGAFPAGDALGFVHLHLEEGHPVEQRVERAKRAEPLAERSVEQYAQRNHRQQDAEFPCKQLAQRRLDAGIGEGQRDGSLQHSLGAEVLAEERIPHANVVHKKRRQQENHHQQHGVFQVRQRLELLCGELLRWDFMQQLLKPTEGAQKAADKASQQNAKQNEESCDIIGKAELGRPHHRLKRPDGAGPGRRRTGVAVQPRHADGLPRPLIQSALEKVRQMQIGQQRRPRLNPAPEAGHGL